MFGQLFSRFSFSQPYDRLTNRSNAELRSGIIAMKANRSWRYAENTADLPSGLAPGVPFETFELAGRQ